MKPKRKNYDWEAIEYAYRAGKTSVREIGRLFGAPETTIRRRAKSLEWARDLTDQVRQRVDHKLASGERREFGATEDQIVEAAASRAAEVIREHRTDILASRQIVKKLLSQLDISIDLQEEMEKVVEEITSDDKSAKRYDYLMKMIGTGEHSKTSNNLANALRTLVALERQAFNLGDKDAPGDEVTGINISFKGGKPLP